MLNYESVPNNILTGKDLDYLSDIFEWNYLALKKTNEALNSVTDEELVSVLNEGYSLFEENLNSVLSILESRGQVNE